MENIGVKATIRMKGWPRRRDSKKMPATHHMFRMIEGQTHFQWPNDGYQCRNQNKEGDCSRGRERTKRKPVSEDNEENLKIPTPVIDDCV